jgi:hypothetical protein
LKDGVVHGAGEVARCTQAFIDDDKRLAAAGIHDAQTTPLAGYPYLRVDRLLASFTDTLTERAPRDAWLIRAAALDAEARALEQARLATPPSAADVLRLQQCRHTLHAALLADEAAWPPLLAAARVDDDYSYARRVLGAYTVTSRLVLAGVRRMQQREMPRVLTAAEGDAVSGERYHLQPRPTPVSTAAPLLSWSYDALGIPLIDETVLAELWRRHAPQLVIPKGSNDDLPGTISSAAPPYVDTREATLYTHLTYTRFEARVLPQLVYTWWFAARSAQGRIDPLAGALDGLSWRVTLDDDGTPLAYDVAHNCGCYHMFFPNERLRARPLADDHSEPPWIPFDVPRAWQGPASLLLASGTHYVQALAPASNRSAEHAYQLQPYRNLRQLPAGTRRVSLFDSRGLVAGSARGERWFLWPMGVVAPGSMRQWGRQATAFVGRRHFDDARLLERYFISAEPTPAAAAASSRE